MAKKQRRSKSKSDSPKPRRAWKEAFLLQFAASGNVLASCIAAGIDRTTAYKAFHADKEFREAWLAAQEDAGDHLEIRADGNLEWEEPVMYEGKIVFVWIDAEGNYIEAPNEEEEQEPQESFPPAGARRVPLTLKKHDAALFLALLKARNPARFADRVKHQHSGPRGGPIEIEAKKKANQVDYEQLASALEKHAASAAARRVRPDGDA